MIDTHGTACNNIDDLFEIEQPIRETFRPDFKVYTQGQPMVSVKVDIVDIVDMAQHLPLDTRPKPYPIPTELTNTIIDTSKEIQTTEAAAKLC